MRLTPSMRRLLPAAASAALLLAGAGGAQAAPATAGAPVAPSPVAPSPVAPPHAVRAPGAPSAAASTGAPAQGAPARTASASAMPVQGMAAPAPYRRLRSLAALSAERAALGDLVAAAKWGTGGPIDDPAREREVLDAVAAQAERLGADPAATRRIFRDQIEASKVVQRGLYRVWTADPARVPQERPDLAKVRTEINRVNEALVRAVAASPEARSAPYCPVFLGVAATEVRYEQRLDALHTRALGRAVRSVCGG